MNGEKKCEWMDYCIRFEKIVCWCRIVPTDEYLAIANTDEQYPISIHIHTAVSVLSSSTQEIASLPVLCIFVYKTDLFFQNSVATKKFAWLQIILAHKTQPFNILHNTVLYA